MVNQDPLQLHTQSSPGERNGKFSQNGKFGQSSKLSQNGTSGENGKVHLGLNISSFTHYCGCTVSGNGATYSSNMSIIFLSSFCFTWNQYYQIYGIVPNIQRKRSSIRN